MLRLILRTFLSVIAFVHLVGPATNLPIDDGSLRPISDNHRTLLANLTQIQESSLSFENEIQERNFQLDRSLREAEDDGDDPKMMTLDNGEKSNGQDADDEKAMDDDLKSGEENKDDDDDDDNDDDDDDDDDEDDDDNDKKGATVAANQDDDDDDDDEFKSQAAHKLLIILLDGFRHDYVRRDAKALKGFARIARNGVHAKSVIPVFPSVSYTNYASIVTGRYPESHGFVDNYIRDRASGDIFLGSPHPNASHARWWSIAEPLWITAEKQRIKTAVYGWDGCQAASADHDDNDADDDAGDDKNNNNNNNNKLSEKKKPRIGVTVCEPYNGYPGSRREKERFRGWLTNVTEDFRNHRYRLAMLYFEGIDFFGHRYGPASRMTRQEVRDVDEMLYDLQDSLTKADLDDEVNVYIVSDHGMIGTKAAKVIELDAYVDMNDIELVLGAGSSMQIKAERGKEMQVFKKLQQANVKGLNVYKRSSIPQRFRLRGARNLLPILLTADKGYQIVAPEINAKVYPDADANDDGKIDRPRGDHGYDADYVSAMRTTMYAFGPDIRGGGVIPRMLQVDHYNAFCRILGLTPRPNNGSEQIVNKIVKSSDDDDGDDDDDDDSKENGKDDDDDDDDDDDNDDDNDKKRKNKKGEDDDDGDGDDENGVAKIHLTSLLSMLILTIGLSNSWHVQF